MLPAVWPGDVLSVCRGSSTQALPGDIILFARQGACSPTEWSRRQPTYLHKQPDITVA